MFTSIKKRLDSFKYAFRGIADAFQSQVHMRVHTVFALGVLSACAWFQVDAWEWAVVLLCIGMVVGLELVNTALEYLVDLVSPDYHPLAGKAKDAAAGAVLVAAIVAVLVAIAIFGSRIGLF